MIEQGLHNSMIVSLVGKMRNFDGVGILQFECADGGLANVTVEPDFNYIPGHTIEIIGHLENKTVQVSIFYSVLPSLEVCGC